MVLKVNTITQCSHCIYESFVNSVPSPVTSYTPWRHLQMESANLGDISGLLNSERSEATEVQWMLCPAAVLGRLSGLGSYRKSRDIIESTFRRRSSVRDRYRDDSSGSEYAVQAEVRSRRK